MLRESLPTNRLGRATGLTGSVISFSAAAGPLIGGLLLAAGSWRYLFLANIPLVLVALTFSLLLDYPDRKSKAGFSADWLGTASLAVVLILVTFLLGTLDGGAGALAIAVGLTGLFVFGAVFWRQQLRSRLPLVEWQLFRSRSYTAASLSVLFSNLVMYTTLLSIPFFIREVLEKGSATAGALLAGMSILTAILTPLTGRFSDEHGRRLPAVCGAVIALGGVALILAGLSDDANVGYLAASLAVMGAGFGLGFGPAATAAIESAPRELAGVAAGTNSMMRYLGSIVGAGVLGSILSANDVPDIDVFRLLFAVLFVVAILSLVASLFIHRFNPMEPPAAVESARPLGVAVSPDS
jgi:MFS family permease